MFEEFLASFDGSEKSGVKTFVRGGIVNATKGSGTDLREISSYHIIMHFFFRLHNTIVLLEYQKDLGLRYLRNGRPRLYHCDWHTQVTEFKFLSLWLTPRGHAPFTSIERYRDHASSSDSVINLHSLGLAHRSHTSFTMTDAQRPRLLDWECDTHAQATPPSGCVCCVIFSSMPFLFALQMRRQQR